MPPDNLDIFTFLVLHNLENVSFVILHNLGCGMFTVLRMYYVLSLSPGALHYGLYRIVMYLGLWRITLAGGTYTTACGALYSCLYHNTLRLL